MKGTYNDRLEQLDKLDQARKQWKESEWRLQFLRTHTCTTSPGITNEELLKWY